jgi:hypothetical protein
MKNLYLLLFCFFFVGANAQKIALNFAGDDDWVTGTNNSLPQGNAPRTIETWIKYSTSRNDMSIFNYGTFASNQKFTLHLYNGVYIIGEGNDLNTGYHFNDGAWHHLAVTHNGTTTIVYVDGIVRGSRNTTYNTTGFNYQMGVSLRNGNWDFRFAGTIDELRIWNVARTQQEIADNMNTLIASAPGLIAYYNFNDGIPNGNNTAITTVADRTGNGNNGTLNNFTLTGMSSNFVDDAIVLPLELLNFSAASANCTATIKWRTADESDMLHFLIEESKDAIDFSSVKQVVAKNTPGENLYTIDLPVYSDKSYYRLKMIGTGDKVSYSKTVLLNAQYCGAAIAVHPNPAKDVLYVRADVIGSEYRIYNNIGILLNQGKITQTLQGLDISKLSNGVYYLHITVGGAEPKSVAFFKK